MQDFENHRAGVTCRRCLMRRSLWPEPSLRMPNHFWRYGLIPHCWLWPESRDFGQGQAGEELASAGGISTVDLSQKFLVCGQNRDFELRDELSGRNQPGFERTLGRDVPVSFNDRFEPRR